MEKVKVLIVEDEPAIAKFISSTLEADNYEVVGMAFTPKKAIQELSKKKPDLVLLDINLESQTDGIDIANLINRQYQIPFIYLTSHTSKDILNRAKLTRPIGFIVKPYTEKDILTTLEIALFNYKLEKPSELSLEMINAEASSPLTDREWDILRGLYEGKGNQELAEENYVSINTVKTHVRNLLSKLNVKSRTALVAKVRKITS